MSEEICLLNQWAHLEKIIVSSFCSVSITKQRNRTTYRLQIYIHARSASCTSREVFRTHSGDGSIAYRGGPAEVASSSALRGLFEPLYLLRHRFLEERPHLQPEAKNEGF